VYGSALQVLQVVEVRSSGDKVHQSQHKITEYAVGVFVRKPEKQQQYEHNTYQISIIGIFSVFSHYDNNTHRLHNTIPIEYLTFSGQPDSNNNNNNFRLLYNFCFNRLQQA
jgi:hypothetical protein